MDLSFSKEEEAFRREVRAFLEDNLKGDFEKLKGRGGPGDEHSFVEERIEWGKVMGRAGWNCIGWPKEHGGRGVSLNEEVIFNEEYVRAGGPGRIGHIGETLLGPTLIHFGTEEQKKRFLPPIVSGEELWCQGYSEPNAGSDLANIQTKARLVGDEWVIEGQKIWTSLAHWSDWCFVLCRTDPDSERHRGISYLLVPMDQPGIEIVPIEQMTGDSEFAEVFFDGAKTHKDNVVGGVNEGWKVAMGTLAFERGASTLGQQAQFERELNLVISAAKENGRARDPQIRQRLADAYIGLRILRYNALRILSVQEGADLGREGSISKLAWSNWHRDFGKLAMDVLGLEANIAEGAPYELNLLQKAYLFSRSDTIYAGTNEIQRNIIAERALGMPKV
ncbi:MAG: acyl-CoA dehydrogenase [Sandaracinaceae bacterium]|nr:acyl-CoA dehydrogenase [Sandaracinaceae bacterium]